MERTYLLILNRIETCRQALLCTELETETAPGMAAPKTPPTRSYASVMNEMENDWNSVSATVMATPPQQSRHAKDNSTPTGSPQSADKLPLEVLLSRIASSNSPQLQMDAIFEHLGEGDDLATALLHKMNLDGDETSDKTSGNIPVTSLLSMQGQSQTASVQLEANKSYTRPKVIGIGSEDEDDPEKLSIDVTCKCQVLVEFKRKRVLQFESTRYVAPGQYVVVGGDRGEDIGLVIYTWCETKQGTVKGIGLKGASLSRSIGVGSGTVLRHAAAPEVSQLHGAISELERRAVEVCQLRVLEFGLPMVIVDAEYQYDKKKLTFYYEAQQRLDFRDLVRDLFKTFRARIWMEPLEE
eukprot:GILI01016218.1.p1 GENE.GILI01016218.1~~GILI01016218.1.p1  ORF type:complete len:390 (-),score=30.26 GILI01016218.1:55-1116(-)